MKLIIDIPEEDYIRLRDEGMFGNVTTFKRAVREGIPLEELCEDAIKHFKNVYELSQTLGVSYDLVNEKIQETVMALKTKPLALSPVTPQHCTDAISRLEGMTNGEVMGAVFPKAKVSRYIDEYERPSDYLIHIDDETYFTKEWWNAPYKGGAE